jgi:uncharacterized protein
MLAAALVQQISTELALAPRQVAQTLALFDEGNTLPFIARYRKEATGGLDEVQLRDVRERAEYLRELEERRAAVLKSVEEQGKLTDALRARFAAAATKQALEDLYLPFKPKRRTRAMIARERGLEPLAELLWAGEATDAQVEQAAAGFVDAAREVPDVAAALQGARDVLAERVAEDAELRGAVRELTRQKGVVRAQVVADKAGEVSKFQDYYDFAQPLREVPSHRALAIRRGEAEGFLTWAIEAPADEVAARMRATVVGARRATAQLALVAQDAYKRLLAPAVTVELRLELKQRADDEAIRIFGRNLEQLLLAAPAAGARWSGSTRASAPASRWRPCRAPARWSRRTRGSCTRASASRSSSCVSSAATAPSWWRSATAPRRARPSSSRARRWRRRRRATRSPRPACGRRWWSSTRAAPRSTRRATWRARSFPSSTCRCAAR